MDEHKLTAGHLMVINFEPKFVLKVFFIIFCLFQKVADMRTVNHTCSKDDETDETDLTEGYLL